MANPTAIQTTRVFMNGRSQAVRIPAEYRFEEDEVFINKIGDTLLLTPITALAGTLRRGVSLISDDFMEDGRPEEIPACIIETCRALTKKLQKSCFI